MKTRRILGYTNISVALSLTITIFPCPTFAIDPTPPEFKSRTEGSNATLSGEYGEGESDPGAEGGGNQPPSGSGDPLPEGRRSRRAQLTTLLLATTVNTPYPTNPVISCFRPFGDALIPLRAIRRRPLPRQPGRFCAALPPQFTPTGPASTNNHRQCHTRTGSSPRASRSPIQPKPTQSHCLAAKSRSRSQR